MSLEIAAWNAKKQLTDDLGTRENVEGTKTFYEGLRQLECADAIILTEPFVTSGPDAAKLREEVLGRLGEYATSAGYHWVHTAYDDEDPSRPNAPVDYDHHMVLLGRSTVTEAFPVRLATRNALYLQLRESRGALPISGVGVHYDDRSESARLRMAQSMLELANFNRDRESFFAIGDFNSMHRSTPEASRLRWSLTRRLVEYTPVRRVNEAGGRLIEMASGETMSLLRSELEEADRLGNPTLFTGPIPVGQVDHLLTRDLDTRLQLRALPGSDHRALVAEITPRQSPLEHFIKQAA